MSFTHQLSHLKLAAGAIFAGVTGILASPSSPKLTIESIDPTDGVQLRASGEPGEYRIEVSENLDEWVTLSAFGVFGNFKYVTDPGNHPATNRFYRIVAWPTAAGFHTEGEFAQQFEAALLSGGMELKEALGLDFDLGGVSSPPAGELAQGDRNSRAYAAVIGALSVLAQNLRDTSFSDTDMTDLIAAIVKDLSSGRLDGTGPDGQPVIIGGGQSEMSYLIQPAVATAGGEGDEPVLPSLNVQDLIASLGTLQSGMEGLENVVFEDSGEGRLQVKIPGQWNSFRWNGADWQ